MIKLYISYQLDANSRREEFISTCPNERKITPTLFDDGHENELAVEAPFIAATIWKNINKWAQRRQVLRNSVACDIEFANGDRISLSPDIINAKHNTEILNS